MIRPSINKVFGFEDCSLYIFKDCALDGDQKSSWSLYAYESANIVYLFPQNLSVPIHKEDYGVVEFEVPIYKDNPDLLKEGCKVWTHPSCSIPRTLLFSKYEKCLNPWTADVIVVPKRNTSGCRLSKYALFVGEKAAVMVSLRDNCAKAESFREGTRFGDVTKALEGLEIMGGSDSLNNTELVYVGDMLCIPNGTPILDAITNGFPTDKTVYESTIQASLADENNKITLESLKSIYEMLISSDENTQSAALKALSMMDYMHYPESVKYMLNNCINSFYYNKTLSATSVKFMFKQLYGSTNRRRYYGRYSRNIYEEDYQLFREVVAYIDNIDMSSVNKQISGYPFMTISIEGILSPILRVA